MKNGLILVLVLILSVSCSSKRENRLGEDEKVSKVFSKTEVASLNIILDFFDDYIQGDNTSEIDVAYMEYFDSLSSIEDFDFIQSYVGYDNSEDVKSLIHKLKEDGVFSEIWRYQYGLNRVTRDSTFVSIDLNQEGKYFQLLKLLGENDEIFEVYVSEIIQSGAIGVTPIGRMAKVNYKEVDFNRDVIRLVWAVHYISILSRTEYLGSNNGLNSEK